MTWARSWSPPSGPQPVHGHLLITHTHWDHIQGFPFFAPLFVPSNVWNIYAPGGLGKRLEETLAGQMEYAYFPVTLGQLGATIRYHDLVEGRFDVGGAQVTARYLNHPGLTLGYRVQAGGAVVVYATDHEPHAKPQPQESSESYMDLHLMPVHREDQGHIAFSTRGRPGHSRCSIYGSGIFAKGWVGSQLYGICH